MGKDNATTYLHEYKGRNGHTEEVLVEYRVDEDDSHCPLSDMDGRVCHIELIQNETPGNGEGTKTMSAFINHIRGEESVNNFYLFASYEPEYHEDESGDKLKGLQRLVRWYERMGFESLAAIRSGDDQIDMKLTL